MALPAFKSILNANADIAGVSLSWLATAVDANDLLLLFVESAASEPAMTPSGWQLIKGLPQISTDSSLAGFWRRATGDETGVTISDTGNHQVCAAYAFTGVGTTGDPWDITVAGIDNTSNTSFSATGGTTSMNDCLIVVVGTSGQDTATDQFSSPANADLSSVTEQDDVFSTSGNGGGFYVVTGGKATAGSFGATTGTLANNNTKAFISIALKPTSAPAISEPWVAYQLTQSAGIGALTPSWAATEVDNNDILLLLVETADQAVSTPSGYSVVADSPQSNSGTTRLSAFYKRADGTETSVSVADSGDHQLAQVMCIRNCHTSGDPWSVTSGGSEGSDTSLTATGDTTTHDNCLVIVAATNDTDLGLNHQFTSWANSDLTNVHVRTDVSTTVGNGGGIAVASGVKSSAGSYGDTTATLATASTKAWMTIAFKAPHAAQTPQSLDTAATAVATVTKETGKTLGAVSAVVATMTRSAGRTLSAAAAVAASLAATAVFGKTLDAAATIATTVSRETGKLVNATVTAVGSLTNQTAKTLTAAVTAVASTTKQVGKTLAATVTGVASHAATIVFGKTLSAAVSVAGAMSREVGKALSAAVSVVIAMTRSVPQTLTLAVTAVATLANQVGKTLGAASTVVASLSGLKVFNRTLDAAVTAVATLGREVGKLLATAQTVAATSTVTVNKILAAAAAVTATATRVVTKNLSVVAAAVLSLAAPRTVAQALTAATTATAAMTRSVGKVLSVPVTLVLELRHLGSAIRGHFNKPTPAGGQMDPSPAVDEFDKPSPSGGADDPNPYP